MSISDSDSTPLIPAACMCKYTNPAIGGTCFFFGYLFFLGGGPEVRKSMGMCFLEVGRLKVMELERICLATDMILVVAVWSEPLVMDPWNLVIPPIKGGEIW